MYFDTAASQPIVTHVYLLMSYLFLLLANVQADVSNVMAMA